MLRAVIDTNVFVSGLISPYGVPGKILKAWENKKITILVNRSILKEIQGVLTRPGIRKYHRLNDRQIHQYCEKIGQFSTLVQESRKPPAIPIDPDDLMLIDCAIAGKAEFLVTGDKELLKLGTLGTLTILSPAEFISKSGLS